MSVNSISAASFHVDALHSNAYALSVQFLNQKQHKLSEKKFTFIAPTLMQEGKIWDVYTHNGHSQSNLLKKKSKLIDQLFDSEKHKEINKVDSFWNNLNVNLSPQDSIVAVFDMPHSDPKIRYLPHASSNPNIIQQTEEVVCAFLKNDKPIGTDTAKNINSRFKTNIPLDFVICEGSLKKDLLENGGFEPEQIGYLNSKEGKKDFCTCAEYFMIGFKLGQTIQGMPPQFSAQHFIKPVSSKFEEYKPGSVSTVFYPELYKESYALDGSFVHGLSTLFDITGAYSEDHKITTLNYKWGHK